MLTITYMPYVYVRQWSYIYIGQVQQPQLVQDHGHDNECCGVMKMGNIVPRVEIKRTSLHSGHSGHSGPHRLP